MKLPEVTRTYQNHTFDSTRWQSFVPRDGDIVVSTSYKSGTTWMQNIVVQLIFWGQENVPLAWEVSPWLDARLSRPIAEVMADLAAQTHRRVLKTHLALDGIPYFPQVKYIVVARDARDVFMSWWNHYSNYVDTVYERMNETPGRVGPPMPRCPDDIHEQWREWITRGWFEWESEGYPHSGNMHHTQTWWNFRHLDNILFVHFNDLLADLAGEIERVAAFLDIAVTADQLTTIAEAVSFATLKRRATADPETAKDTWKEGMATFFHKGTNGRWRDVLSAEEVALYEETAAKVLTPDCQAWLEQGRSAWD
jgi:aryl sulfotransferase